LIGEKFRMCFSVKCYWRDDFEVWGRSDGDCRGYLSRQLEGGCFKKGAFGVLHITYRVWPIQ